MAAVGPELHRAAVADHHQAVSVMYKSSSSGKLIACAAISATRRTIVALARSGAAFPAHHTIRSAPFRLIVLSVFFSFFEPFQPDDHPP
ncbi:hypothetical protein I6F35_35330 [Bradyrhizobium sp. BRP22]|uniref:hypothetical protein n=1 Tax=Bradyrhizobium sp. BRP22 TaxID=2793821 RepID=UPI001CD4E5DB|nr:hypothetical protein [Bradyrhizobium sp. BRP22]MCA1458395.1 hypothetical protein [Bradyrhizobium sp. BRP22]